MTTSRSGRTCHRTRARVHDRVWLTGLAFTTWLGCSQNETEDDGASSDSQQASGTSSDSGPSGTTRGVGDEGTTAHGDGDESTSSAGPSTDNGGEDTTGGGSDTGDDPGPMVFGEVSGVVAVEAEHFVDNDDNGAPRSWYLTTLDRVPGIEPDPDPSHADVASAQAYLEGLPDTRVTHDDPIQEGESIFNNVGTGPTLSYRVDFQTAGTYVVWVRAYSTGGEDNGIHVGIDGEWPASGERIQFCSGKNQWTWSSAQRDSDGPCGVDGTITIEVDTPGEHTIAFSMREDGFEFDKWVLALDPEFVPEGEGPAENPLE